MKRIEIVKIGYERLNFYELYHTLTIVFNDWYNYTVLDFERGKETIKEEIKNFLSYYYLKDALFNEPLNRMNMIYSTDAKQEQYRIVTIPQKELEMILVKNKLSGNLTLTNLIQEKEFDKTFDALYSTLIELVTHTDNKRVEICERNSKNRV